MPMFKPTRTMRPVAIRFLIPPANSIASARAWRCTRRAGPLFRAGAYKGSHIPYGDKTIPAYLRIPRDGRQHSVVINFGGIDSLQGRELSNTTKPLQEAGMGTCAVDMPGVGECPIKASTTADALYQRGH